MSRVTWRGHTFDTQTRDMLVELDKLVGPNVSIKPTQGSYSTGVGASAGTHAGGGAVDLSVAALSSFQVELVVFLARRLGFAAWHRLPGEGPWNQHIHMINKTAPGLSGAAQSQVMQYMSSRNGLANHGFDKHANLDAPRDATWKSYLANWETAK